MTMEIWKDINGYEGLYQVSNLGRVKNLERRVRNHKSGSTRLMREGVMSAFNNGNGYLVVSLRKNGCRKNHYVHRLVATAFIDNPHDFHYVNHIDRNRSNNVADNLEWCTQLENIAHSIDNLRNRKSKSRPTNTGEKYISKILDHGKNTRYRVYIRGIGIRKTFKTLDEAVRYRNEVM